MMFRKLNQSVGFYLTAVCRVVASIRARTIPLQHDNTLAPMGIGVSSGIFIRTDCRGPSLGSPAAITKGSRKL